MPEDSITSERIDSWKDIAAYLGHDARTAVRWEKEKQLPIHRISGGRRHCVFAYRHELDAWLAGQDRLNGVNLPVTGGNGSIAVSTSPPTPAPGTIPPVSFLTRVASSRKLVMYSAAGLLAALLLVAAAYRSADSRFSLHIPQLTGQKQLTENDQAKQGLLTSGKDLYFGQEQDGRMALASMPADGGPVRILWNPAANVLPVALSPDGSRVLAFRFVGMEKERELWIVPTDGEAPRRLSGITAHSAAWEPNGKGIAYATGNKIYLTSENGTATREIGSFAGVPDALHWSEDADGLLFVLVDITTLKPSFWELVSKDGMATATLRSLPFAMEEYGDYTLATRKDAWFLTGPADQLGNTPIFLVQHGRKWWEPAIQMSQLPMSLGDVHGIAFDRELQRLFVLNGPPSRSTFVRFDPRTQGFRQILPGISGNFLDYSRDGQWIAYTSSSGDALWVSRAEGSAVRRFAFPPEEVQLPRWSPDGKQIAYMAKEPDRPWRIFIQRLDNGEKREASEGDDNQGAPTWSPDGRFLVYGNVKCQLTHSCAIRRIDLATGKVQTLPGSEGLFTARWSPEGRDIAALQPEQHQVFLFNVATQKWHKLADAVDGTDMSWSPDSKYVYVDIPGADARIARIRIADGHWETAANLRSQDIFALAEVEDLGFSVAPDDSVILHRRTHSSEIYAYDVRDR
jgi:Tol biopolymer transport system component